MKYFAYSLFHFFYRTWWEVLLRLCVYFFRTQKVPCYISWLDPGSNQVLLTLLEGANVLNLHIGQPKDISDLEANQHEKETEVNEGITGAAEGDRQLVDSKTNLIGGGSLENSKVDASLSNLSDPSHSKSGMRSLNLIYT